MDKIQAFQYLDAHKKTLADLSDRIWDYAETAFEEYRSVALLKETLRGYGFVIEENTAGIETAFSASYGSGGPVIGILAEYDALSGMSQRAGCPVREEDTPGGNGHGCGHNLLGAGAAGAAMAVKEYLEQNNLSGTVRLFGCPGEEGGSGKAFMAREGAFQGLDAVFTWHPMAYHSIFDVSMLANYQVLYRYKGTAAHAASAPELGRSALDAVELMNVGVNFLREHVIQEARIHYAITNTGGFSPNVVQPYAEVLYLIRAPKTPQVEEIYRRINKIAQGAAMMTETEVEIQFIKACANIVPNKTLSAVLYENFRQIELPSYDMEEGKLANAIVSTLDNAAIDCGRFTQMPAAERKRCAAHLQGKPLCDILFPFYEHASDGLLPGSSDVGDVSWNVPTAQIVAACYAVGTPDHSWQLVAQGRTSIGHKGMLLAAKVMAGAAIDVLNDPTIAERAKTELADRLDGQEYHCAIPKGVKPKAISKL